MIGPTHNQTTRKGLLNNFRKLELEVERQRRWCMPWQDEYAASGVKQLESGLDHRTFRIQPRDSEVQLPLRSEQDVHEVLYLDPDQTVSHSGSSLQKPQLGEQLKTLAGHGWKFLARDTQDKQVEVGLYGAYNILTEDISEFTKLSMTRGNTQVRVGAEEIEQASRFKPESAPLLDWLERKGYRLLTNAGYSDRRALFQMTERDRQKFWISNSEGYGGGRLLEFTLAGLGSVIEGSTDDFLEALGMVPDIDPNFFPQARALQARLGNGTVAARAVRTLARKFGDESHTGLKTARAAWRSRDPESKELLDSGKALVQLALEQPDGREFLEWVPSMLDEVGDAADKRRILDYIFDGAKKPNIGDCVEMLLQEYDPKLAGQIENHLLGRNPELRTTFRQAREWCGTVSHEAALHLYRNVLARPKTDPTEMARDLFRGVFSHYYISEEDRFALGSWLIRRETSEQNKAQAMAVAEKLFEALGDDLHGKNSVIRAMLKDLDGTSVSHYLADKLPSRVGKSALACARLVLEEEPAKYPNLAEAIDFAQGLTDNEQFNTVEMVLRNPEMTAPALVESIREGYSKHSADRLRAAQWQLHREEANPAKKLSRRFILESLTNLQDEEHRGAFSLAREALTCQSDSQFIERLPKEAYRTVRPERNRERSRYHHPTRVPSYANAILDLAAKKPERTETMREAQMLLSFGLSAHEDLEVFRLAMKSPECGGDVLLRELSTQAREKVLAYKVREHFQNSELLSFCEKGLAMIQQRRLSPESTLKNLLSLPKSPTQRDCLLAFARGCANIQGAEFVTTFCREQTPDLWRELGEAEGAWPRLESKEHCRMQAAFIADGFPDSPNWVRDYGKRPQLEAKNRQIIQDWDLKRSLKSKPDFARLYRAVSGNQARTVLFEESGNASLGELNKATLAGLDRALRCANPRDKSSLVSKYWGLVSSQAAGEVAEECQRVYSSLNPRFRSVSEEDQIRLSGEMMDYLKLLVEASVVKVGPEAEIMMEEDALEIGDFTVFID